MDSNASTERIAGNEVEGTLNAITGRHWLALAGCVAIYLTFVFLTSDVRSAFLIGGDDGLELSKASLLVRKPAEASRMWNDQPWFHTLMTGVLFRILGEKVWIPRLI
jgi:hypothetical protein